MLAFRNYKTNNMTKKDIVANRTKASEEILSQFKPGVALSARTLKRRTHNKNRVVLGVVKRLMAEGKLRRVESREVGSNKFMHPSEEQIQQLQDERHKSKINGDKKKRYPQARRFHVFMLTN